MKKKVTILLTIIAIVCFAGSVSYPLYYKLQSDHTEADIEDLRAIRSAGTERAGSTAYEEETGTGTAAETRSSHAPEEKARTAETTMNAAPEPTATPQTGSTLEPVKAADNALETEETEAPEVAETTVPPVLIPKFTESAVSTPEPYSGAPGYYDKTRVYLEEDKILPQYREIYELNHDTVGWLTIDGTDIDYPVMQNEDDEYYLHRDFYGRSNINGQLLIFNACDVWTPSYNVVISGHNMKNGKMFGQLTSYASEPFWENHKTFEFDTMMREGQYVVTAAFYSANYDDDEEGFRYLVNIEYPRDYKDWIAQVREYALYETGIDTRFGDEFLTLTTCAYQRRDGRFVVIARRIREGEMIE